MIDRLSLSLSSRAENNFCLELGEGNGKGSGIGRRVRVWFGLDEGPRGRTEGSG